MRTLSYGLSGLLLLVLTTFALSVPGAKEGVPTQGCVVDCKNQCDCNACPCEKPSRLDASVLWPSVEVRVVAEKPDMGVGSGTLIKLDDEILVLTAGHVADETLKKVSTTTYYTPHRFTTETISKYPPMYVVTHESNTTLRNFAADIVYYSPVEDNEKNPGCDLALLKPRAGKGDVFHCAALLHCSCKDGCVGCVPSLQRGEDILFVGNPAGIWGMIHKTVVSRTDYIVGADAPELGDATYTLATGPVWFGNSGGGLFVNRKGSYYLAGVVTRTFTPEKGSPKYMLAKTDKEVQAFLESYRKSKTKPACESRVMPKTP